MARIETDPNYNAPTFSRATAATDLFKKEDVQALAAAMSTHVHDGSGKGLQIATLPASAIPTGLITSAMIADGTIVEGDIADGAITSVKIQNGSITVDDIAPTAVSRTFVATGSASGPATTSAVPVDMPDMALTFSVPFTSQVFYWFSGAFTLSGAGAIGIVTLELDGASTLLNYIQQTGINLTLTSHEARATLAAGTHTIKVRWWLVAAGTLTATATYRQLTLLEMHR